MNDQEAQKQEEPEQCIGNHLEPKEAEYDSPAPLCERCWNLWWNEEMPS